MCSVWFLQITVVIYLNSIKMLGFVMETQCSFCKKWIINDFSASQCWSVLRCGWRDGMKWVPRLICSRPPKSFPTRLPCKLSAVLRSFRALVRTSRKFVVTCYLVRLSLLFSSCYVSWSVNSGRQQNKYFKRKKKSKDIPVTGRGGP
jgi:hypothetical protein